MLRCVSGMDILHVLLVLVLLIAVGIGVRVLRVRQKWWGMGEGMRM